MINKNLTDINENDLNELITNARSEDKTIEYKSKIDLNTDKEKKEFLADISSFANAIGGDIIFGISEDRNTGKPLSVDGLEIDNPDKEISKIENIIRDGIQPRIMGLEIRPITLLNSKVVIIIRIPQSIIGSHMIIYDKYNKFYSRNSNGKYLMDVGELRIAFNYYDTIIEKIRNLRLNRISKIGDDETPVEFYGKAKIVLHLIPISSFNPNKNYGLTDIDPYKINIIPINCPAWGHKYNFDGLLYYSAGQDNKSHSYVQLFRNGIIEAVEGLLLDHYFNPNQLTIPSRAYEEKLVKSLSQYLSVLKSLGVELPILIFLTLLKVKGYKMALSSLENSFCEVHPIDRDMLILPEILIESYDMKAEEVLKPCFDYIWNACGLKGSFNYDEQGNWIER